MTRDEMTSTAIGLHSRFPLDQHTERVGDIELQEQTELAIVSLAVPINGQDAFANALQTTTGLAVPAVGQRSVSEDSESNCILGLQTDQYFLVFDYPTDGRTPVQQLNDTLGKHAYLSDQSDSWVILDISGPTARLALERICPIDLHADVFGIKHVARTTMEHLSVIIEGLHKDRFRTVFTALIGSFPPRSCANICAQYLLTT